MLVCTYLLFYFIFQLNSYKSLEGGSVADAMVDFSGGCSEVSLVWVKELWSEPDNDICFQRYELNDKSRWMEIYQAMQIGWEGKPRSLISCHLKPDPEVLEAKTSTGLVRGHAYSVTKVVRARVDTGNRKGEFPLVRVRNPWGEKVRVTLITFLSIAENPLKTSFILGVEGHLVRRLSCLAIRSGR